MDIEDDECDIDTLTSLLEENSEDGFEEAIGKDEQNRDNHFTEEDIDSFLGGSDSETEERLEAADTKCIKEADNPKRNHEKDECTQKTMVKNQQSVPDLQAQLLMMQEQMEKLKNQLERQSEVKTKENTKHVKTNDEQEAFNIDANTNIKNNKKASPQPMQKLAKTSLSSAPNTIKLTKEKSNVFFDEKDKNEIVKEQDVFGDSDSDWEDLDGEKSRNLSNEGRQIKHLLDKDQQDKRISMVSSEDVSELRQKAAKWSDKPSNLGGSSSCASAGDAGVVDPFSGIRIINPKVSSLEMKYKVGDRSVIKLSRLESRLNTPDIQGNWVTIGVIVRKTDTRQSASGNSYSIWTLSDLNDCNKTVNFFLFGQVLKELWKNEVRTVIGVLNPNIMDKAEKAQKEVAFTVKHPQQVLIMGHSKDLGKCSSVTKNGNPCTNFINRAQGDKCCYHVQSAYRKTSAKRGELQGSFTGVTPKNYMFQQQKKGNKDAFFFYEGKTYTTLKQSQTSNGKVDKQKKVTVGKLLTAQENNKKSKVTTMALHNLTAEDKSKLEKYDEAKSGEFLQMLNTPTAGSLNLVGHLIKEEKIEKNKEDKKKGVIFQSITAKDLLKTHHNFIKEKKKQISTKPVDPLSKVPSLGKGCQPGGDVFLEVSSSPSSSRSTLSPSMAKKLAIAKIKLAGGISKEDPNAVKKKTSPESQQRVKKRVLENIENEENATTQSPEPPRKRSKLLGNVDVDSEEFKKFMKARSKHTGALAEVEAEHQERYFMELEKKERYEDKMSSIMEIPCKVFTCLQCKYTHFKPLESCKKENHAIKTTEAVKRFFKCKDCKNRCTSISKYPKDSCKNCGGSSFERTSMHQERKGPKLSSEELCIRGDESKFIGALNEKVYLN